MNTKDIIIATALLTISSLGFSSDSEHLTENSNSSNTKSDRASIGDGYFQTYSKVFYSGKPKTIGVKFPKSTLDNLPMHPLNDAKSCYDLDANNEVDADLECTGGHSRTLYFNSTLTPFSSITVNWEPHGHVPSGIYDSPHFDFHFYMYPEIERQKILPGPCPGVMNCAQQQKAIEPVPAQYIPPNYINTELAFARMGNHYVDETSPELNGEEFTHTFILGSYDSKVTFFEPMLSRNYLLTKPRTCIPIKQPLAFEISGYYPTKYCMRYNQNNEMYKISLEGFVYRNAG